MKRAIDTALFAPYPTLPNSYQHFDSPKAIHAVVEMENAYFKTYQQGLSPFYGTVWREYAEASPLSPNPFEHYRATLGEPGDSMHCTIYAVKALSAGMGKRFGELETSHRRIWKQREHAGWSIGYLLVKEWGWKAYLILDRNSTEFTHCQQAFQQHQSYPVWRQPDIPLEALYLRGTDDSLIQDLLLSHEFGWGFSEQGIHTWITRFDQLKECNWLGAPGKAVELSSNPLFLRTPFLEYRDYASHVVIFPPKQPMAFPESP